MSLIKLLEINELTSEPNDKLKLSIAVVAENIYSTHSNFVQHVRPEVFRAISNKGFATRLVSSYTDPYSLRIRTISN